MAYGQENKKTVPENGAGCDDAELWRPRQIEASKGDFDPSEAGDCRWRTKIMGVVGNYWGLGIAIYYNPN
jgi:hypothetical protein